jgi:uncharacterized protein YndB with AHSA1/START domain
MEQNVIQDKVVADIIEKDIFIKATEERVWSLVSRAGFWVGEDLHFEHEAAEGQTVTIETEKWGNFPVRVESLKPTRYAAYRWASSVPGADLSDVNSTLVEFTIVPASGGVTVKVRESGFAGLEGDHIFLQQQYEGNDGGWRDQMANLKRAAESDTAQ